MKEYPKVVYLNGIIDETNWVSVTDKDEEDLAAKEKFISPVKKAAEREPVEKQLSKFKK